VAAIAATGPGGLIGRRAARELARRELSKSVYQPSSWQRIIDWLNRLFNSATSSVPGGWWSAVALAVAAVLLITAVLLWVRPARARRAASPAVLTGRPRSAADYRRSAETLAAAGDYSQAIVERVRAIAAELAERGIVPARPGRTAHELAEEAAAELPAHAAELRSVMRLFDDIRYGDRPGSEPGYRRASQLDGVLRSARPAAGAVPVPDSVVAGR
jgi:Domain of unknown function (DUF4129)